MREWRSGLNLMTAAAAAYLNTLANFEQILHLMRIQMNYSLYLMAGYLEKNTGVMHSGIQCWQLSVFRVFI